MAHLATGSVGRQIESLFDGGSVSGFTDRQLLERFSARRDSDAEVAFATLVARHGPMVLGICRQILGDRHDAEDAFQAVFLVLACRGRSIRNPDLMGNWLYGVALRTAHKVKARLRRQRQNEEGLAMSGSAAVTMSETMVSAADVSTMAREQAGILHDEVARLPKQFRQAVVLCYFEGLAVDQASQRLRWPAGTLRSRLARARDKLRRALTRRGVALPSAAFVAALSPRSASASVTSHLCEITTRAAIKFAAQRAADGPVSPFAAALAREVLGSMLFDNFKISVLTLLVLGTIACGAGLVSHSVPIKDAPKGPPAGQPPPAEKPDEPFQRVAPGRMFVTGRVLDPQGKPVPDAATMVYARLKEPGRGDSHQQMSAAPLGETRSDSLGRFRLDAPRTSSARNDLFGAVALAPGFGVGWVELDPDAEQPTTDIILRPEQVIQGHLLDLRGQPARDVKVIVSTVGLSVDGKFDGPHFSWTRAVDFPAWPRSVTSDSDGRFMVRGIGRNLQAVLAVDDPRFARLRIPVQTDNARDPKQVPMALEPARFIAGRLAYADTEKPVPHAPIHILAYKGSGGYLNEFETDAEGRFRANPLAADRYSVSVVPPEGQPYLGVEKGFSWTKGALEHSIDLTLPRGAVIHGKVTEAGSETPLAGARVNYHSRPLQNEKSGAMNGRSGTGPDGSFRFAVMPGPGYLVVQAPSDDYVLQEIGSRMVEGGQPGGRRFYANAFVAGDMKLDSAGLEINVKLRRGVTVQGQVVRPDGKPVQEASMISRVILSPYPGAYRTWRVGYQGAVRNGRFELHGLDPEIEAPVFFLEPKSKLGATLNVSGKSAAGGPIAVRLESCGMAKAWLVDPSGKPVEGYRDPSLIVMIVTPGPVRLSLKTASQGQLAAHQATLADIDPTNHANSPVSDTRGRIAFPALIPGATYRVIDRTTSGEAGPRVRKEFTVKPGEMVELGDILIEKPQVER